MLWFIFSALQKRDKYGKFLTLQMIKDKNKKEESLLITYWTILFSRNENNVKY